MEITEAILSCGIKAVKRYTEMARPQHDNGVPECFISSLIASQLYDSDPEQVVKLERQYVDLASDLDIAMTPEERQAVLQLRADIVIYQGGRPRYLIEVKKFDEGCPVQWIDGDLHKGDQIGLNARIDVYAGVMVCETNVPLDARKRQLEQLERCHWTFSPSIEFIDHNWFWCFACGKRSA